MTQPTEIDAAGRLTTLDGLAALIAHLQDAIDTQQLDPRFVEKLVKRMREELKHDALIEQEGPMRLTVIAGIEALSLRVIQAKADGLSEMLGRLRNADRIADAATSLDP